MFIVLHYALGVDEDATVYGPFASSDEATKWGHARWGVGGDAWGWQEVQAI